MCIRDSLKLTSLSALIERLTDTPLTTANELTHYDDSREWLVACRDAVSYTHLDVYKRQVQDYMDQLAEITGRHYHLFDYYGDPEACLLYTSRSV